jgi:tungstate transport system substrate-binding protein
MVMVHAPAAGRKATQGGLGDPGKTLIGSNEFYIVGPKSDPAGIAAAASAAEAYRRIAAGARFVSRGDNSGTHQKEMQIWQRPASSPPATGTS